jgi:twinkle protein
MVIEHLKNNFNFINTNETDISIDGILNKTSELVLRKGIKGLLIDPWNYIEHNIPNGYSETQYISECLTKIKKTALKLGIHIIIIAHPTKLQKDKTTGKYEVPTLYSISGSAHFFNKTDNGITVYRDFQTNDVTVYVQKVRYSWLGKIGFITYKYNTLTRQYEYIE